MSDLAELLDHGCRHFVHGHHAAELVGLGEEIAFERGRAGGEVGDKARIQLRYFQEILRGPESGSLDGAGNIEHGEAFGHHHRMEINVATLQPLLNLEYVPRFVEEIFSGFQRTAVANVAPENKRFLAPHDYAGL